MKFASWNINSINLRKDAVLKWMSDENIDVLGLQEIKCETEKFPQDFFKENDYYKVERKSLMIKSKIEILKIGIQFV